MISLHRICQNPENCLCKWLSAFQSARETFVNFFPSPEKFLFCTGTTESIEWQNLVPRLSIDVPRFTSFVADFVISCNQITKFLCLRCRITSSPSARSPCNFGSLAHLAIVVLREVTINTVLSWCHFHTTFRIWVMRNVCGVQTMSTISKTSRCCPPAPSGIPSATVSWSFLVTVSW